jgi:hypothetical protein
MKKRPSPLPAIATADSSEGKDANNAATKENRVQAPTPLEVLLASLSCDDPTLTEAAGGDDITSSSPRQGEGSGDQRTVTQGSDSGDPTTLTESTLGGVPSGGPPQYLATLEQAPLVLRRRRSLTLASAAGGGASVAIGGQLAQGETVPDVQPTTPVAVSALHFPPTPIQIKLAFGEAEPVLNHTDNMFLWTRFGSSMGT